MCQEKDEEDSSTNFNIQVLQKNNKEILIVVDSSCNVNLKKNSKITKSRKQKWEEKHVYGYFKRQIVKIAHEMTWK